MSAALFARYTVPPRSGGLFSDTWPSGNLLHNYKHCRNGLGGFVPHTPDPILVAVFPTNGLLRTIPIHANRVYKVVDAQIHGCSPGFTSC
jgi:hypothetical protein